MSCYLSNAPISCLISAIQPTLLWLLWPLFIHLFMLYISTYIKKKKNKKFLTIFNYDNYFNYDKYQYVLVNALNKINERPRRWRRKSKLLHKKEKKKNSNINKIPVCKTGVILYRERIRWTKEVILELLGTLYDYTLTSSQITFWSICLESRPFSQQPLWHVS